LDSVGWNYTLFEKVPQACRYFVGSDYGFLFIFKWATHIFFVQSDNAENNYCSELLDMSLKSITACWESGDLARCGFTSSEVSKPSSHLFFFEKRIFI